MANDKLYKIIPKRFEEMEKESRGLFFQDENGLPIYSKNPPRHRLRKDVKKDIAELLDISPVTLSRNVHGIQAPSQNTLELLKKHYGINPAWLCDVNVKDMHITEAVQNFISNAKLIDNIFIELLTLNNIPCEENKDPDITIREMMYKNGYTIDGLPIGSEELHDLALKVKHYVKFETEHFLHSRRTFLKHSLAHTNSETTNS